MPFSSPAFLPEGAFADDAGLAAMREELGRSKAQLLAQSAEVQRLRAELALRDMPSSRPESDAPLAAAPTQRERLQQQILDRMPGAVAYWDAALTLRFCNAYLMRHWAGKPQPLIGQHMSAILSKRGLTRSMRHVGEALAGRESSGEHVEHGFTAHVSYSPDIEEGVVKGFIVMAVDVSELKDARAAAEQASLAKSAFLASVSHEIRTPLNAVLGFAQVGALRSKGEAAAEHFQHILHSGRLLLGLINDVLDFSMIDAGGFDLSPGDMPLDACIDSAVRSVRGQARDKGLALHAWRDPAMPAHWQGDAARVEQILVKLLGNAVKFTDRGEVRLTAWADAQGLRFSVADTGQGMTPEVLARLFKPFERGDASATRRVGGTGLGLSICWRLATLMGGGVTVDSEVGKGTRVDVMLPLAPLSPAAVADPRDEPRRSETHWLDWGLQGLRVLVAEDHSVNQLLLEQLLLNVGAVMTCVDNGREAVEVVRRAGAGAFDIVLCDIEMPVMDGYEATREIRRIDPTLPVLGLTAHAVEHARERGLSAGMADYLTKPFDHETLMREMGRHARRV
jgi:signal transduction histidine kinase